MAVVPPRKCWVCQKLATYTSPDIGLDLCDEHASEYVPKRNAWMETQTKVAYLAYVDVWYRFYFSNLKHDRSES